MFYHLNNKVFPKEITWINFIFIGRFTLPSSREITGTARGLPERSEFRSARLFRAAQGSPPQAHQVIGCTFFWFVFFMQVKKMNV